MKAPSKKSSIIAAIIWVISIVLAFKIPAGNSLIWLPDTLLLVGFFPLFISVRSPWLWLSFGLLDVFIGVILLIALSAPQEELARRNLVEMNAQMQSYHPYYVWALVGVVSIIIAFIQLIWRIVLWLYRSVIQKKI
jgi:hypothetical protein